VGSASLDLLDCPIFIMQFLSPQISYVREIRYFSEHPENLTKKQKGFLDINNSGL